MRNWLLNRFLLIMLVPLVCFSSVGAIDEDYTDRMLFADGLFAREMYELAIREYASILRSFPKGESNDAATFRLAESLRLNGDSATAARFYDRVVADFRTSPYRLRAAYRRARIYADDGVLDAAQAHLEVILSSDPEPALTVATLYHLGDVLFRKKQFDQADQYMEKLLSTDPDGDFSAFALLKRAEIRRSKLAQKDQADGSLAPSLVAEALAFYEKAREVADTDRLKAEILFQMADIHFRVEDYAKAASLYRSLLRDYPEDPRAREARMQAAWSALRSELYAEAMHVAKLALADEPDHEMADEWLYILANSQRQLLQTEDAAETYSALMRRFPESRFASASRYETAVAYYQAGDFTNAVREAEQIPLDDAMRVDVSWLLAESYAAMERPAEAVQHYRIVVREAGQTDRGRDALYRLAHHLQKQGAYREASRFYLKMVEDFPTSELAPQALFASGFALAQADAYDEAVRDWRRLAQEYPQSALTEEALYQKAMGEIRLERGDEALNTLAEFKRRFPESRYVSDALYWLGMLFFEDERFADAEPPLRQALAKATRDELKRDAQFQLGLVLQQLGQPEESAGLLDELISSPLRRKFPPALLEWLASQHGEKQAYARMEEAASLLAEQEEPAWQQSGKVLLGRAKFAQGDAEAAEQAWRSALEIPTKTTYAGEAALRLGILLTERKAYDEAEAFLRSVSQYARGADADAFKARSLIWLGKTELAREDYQAASRLFLSVGILYDDASLVPESLYLAAESLAKLDKEGEREKVVSEMGQRYPESEWTVKARETWPR
jgi:TolA-binding protein